MSAEIILQIGLKYLKIVSSEDCAKYYLLNKWTLEHFFVSTLYWINFNLMLIHAEWINRRENMC